MFLLGSINGKELMNKPENKSEIRNMQLVTLDLAAIQ